MLYQFQLCNMVIQYFIDYTSFKVITKYFPVQYNISWLLIYFIHSSLYFLIPHTRLAPPPFPLPTGNH